MDRRLTVWLRAVFACLFLLVGTFALPYLAPVRPSVAVSYVVNFNNHAAVLFFIVGALLVAYLAPWSRPGQRKDSSLSWWYLFAAVVTISFLCLNQVYGPYFHYPGTEVIYNLDRLNKLAAGRRLYQDFEYCYGPLLLYGPLWFSKAANVSLLNGYYGFWSVEWAAGVALLWYAVRWIDVPTPHRGIIFIVLCAVQAGALANEGISYTPVRDIGAAGLVVFVHRVWIKSTDGWRLAGASALVGVLGLAVSTELGLSLFAGLGVWIGMLSFRREVSTLQFGSFVLVSGACCGTAAYLGLFVTMRTFSGGAYGFPLVLSFAVLIILSLYIISIRAAFVDVREGRWHLQTIPLVTVLLIALPAAFNRCDLGHLQFGATGIVLGLCLVQSLPVRRRWAWNVLAVVSLGFSVAKADARIAWHGVRGLRERFEPATYSFGYPPLRAAEVPPGTYFSPVMWPYGTPVEPGVHVETGYYSGIVDVFTPDAISSKLHELQSHAGMPLVLAEKPLEIQFPALETDPRVVLTLENGWYVPKARNSPVTYQPIIDFIRSHYRPGPSARGSTVWTPIAESGL